MRASDVRSHADVTSAALSTLRSVLSAAPSSHQTDLTPMIVRQNCVWTTNVRREAGIGRRREEANMAGLTFDASLNEAFCWHCDSPIVREGELRGFPFYVHLDHYGTCVPEAGDSTSATPLPPWN